MFLILFYYFLCGGVSVRPSREMDDVCIFGWTPFVFLCCVLKDHPATFFFFSKRRDEFTLSGHLFTIIETTVVLYGTFFFTIF